MNLKIKTGTVGYNNKVSYLMFRKFSLGKNDKVNALKLAVPQKVIAQTTTTHKDPNNVAQKPTITHEEEKLL